MSAWLPTGHHEGLEISHHPASDAGDFVTAKPKIVWHTTEGTSLSGAIETLTANGDEPHFVVSNDGRQVVQFIGMDRTSKSLRHPSGTPETNRAHCIQVEICGFAAQSHQWPDTKYVGLAHLALLIERFAHVERRTHVGWANPRRIAAGNFAGTGGHVGHMHVPNNDHVDPGTGFRIGVLFDHMEKMS